MSEAVSVSEENNQAQDPRLSSTDKDTTSEQVAAPQASSITTTTTTTEVPAAPRLNPPALSVGASSDDAPAESGPEVTAEHSTLVHECCIYNCAGCRGVLSGREPQLLPCLHSFCRSCLPSAESRVITPNLPTATGDNTALVVRCPVCLQDFRPADIIDNYFVLEGGEGANGSSQNLRQVCTSCEDGANAEKFCVQCVEWLCNTCVGAHQRVKFTKDHAIRKKEEVSPEIPQGRRPLFCPLHRQEQLRLFCESCDKLTCRDCQLLEHKDHRYQFLEEAFKTQKTIIETLTDKLQEKKNYIDQASTQVQNRLTEEQEVKKKVEHDIKVTIFTLMSEINRKGKSLMQQLENMSGKRQEQLRIQQREVVRLARQVDHVIDFSRLAVAGGNALPLLFSKRLIFFQLRRVLRAPCEPCPLPPGTLRFHCDSNLWAKNVFNLGSIVYDGRRPNSLPVSPTIVPSVFPPGQGPPAPPAPFPTHAHPFTEHFPSAGHRVPRPIPQRPNLFPSSSLAVGERVRPGEVAVMQPPSSLPPQVMPTVGIRNQGGRASPLQHMQHLSQSVGANAHSRLNRPPPPFMSTFAPHPTLRPSLPIPSVTNPENLPYVPDIPQIQLDDLRAAGIVTGAGCHGRSPTELPPYPHLSPAGSIHSPLPSAPSPSFQGVVPALQPPPPPSLLQRPSSASSNSSRNSVTSDPLSRISIVKVEQVKVKTEPSEGSVALRPPSPSIGVKHELTQPPNRSSCMVNTPESNLTPPASNQSETEGEGEQPQPGLQGPSPNSDSDRVGGKYDDPNEDWCGVCQNGGDLLCCDRCPKVFHLSCHVPSLLSFPSGEWLCTFCRDMYQPQMEYDCENERHTARKAPSWHGLSPTDQRKCERILLHLFCHELSPPFHEPVSHSVPNYYRRIKHPMDLSSVRLKLQRKHLEYYKSPAEVVSDMHLIFQNCARFNKFETEIAKAGRELSQFFDLKLRDLFPDTTFSRRADVGSQEHTDSDLEFIVEDGEDEDFDEEEDEEVESEEKEKEEEEDKGNDQEVTVTIEGDDEDDDDDDDEEVRPPRRKRHRGVEHPLHIH